SSTLTITEPDEIFITGSADVAITYGLSTTLTAETNTLDLTGVTWAPDGGVLGCEDDPCFIYTVTPVVTTEYYVSITDENGCFAIDTILVTVIYSNEVLVPNAFTPNGDNVNDLFQGIAYNLNSYHMVIYNRWGQLVYETNTADYYAGWDGKYQGEEQEMGTYVYFVEALFNTGVSYSGQGSFQLIR
ncbi:MAG TPA: gliding motility-associated C-terminal domain-containing protein, partial [Chitinophagales bacterium]|nr:gliding motility-associated C-terminal domain-containing protein [Chitinophagales bacterium]